MKCKTAFLIINPRSGENLAKLAEILAVFSAAGWKTDVALKEFGRHTRQLAREAADAGYDLVVAYGGDGTLNQVVNGVMASKDRGSIVGLIPGGTANVWAHEIGIPEDPVKAALLLVNSQGRKVDLGHVQVVSSTQLSSTNNQPEHEQLASGGRHHFLLMAGLGIDAAILRRVSVPLKERIGEAAVAIAAVKELPSHHSFPIEIRSSHTGKKEGLVWKGSAVQVIVGNTRRYGNIAELTSDAFIDDGVLDVCVIAAGGLLTTIGQIISFLLRRPPHHERSDCLKGAHFWITVPGYVGLQLDGSRVKVKECSTTPDRAPPLPGKDPAPVMVTYRFDAMPGALHVAIPHTYDDTLFETRSAEARALVAKRAHPAQHATPTLAPNSIEIRHQSPKQIGALLEDGRTVTVTGVGPNPARRGTCIVAGGTSEKNAGESKPVAVRIDGKTSLFRPTGEPLPPAFATELAEGGVIVVEGRRSKRGVIRAKRVVVV